MAIPETTAIESAWGIKLPSRFGAVDDIPWNAMRLPDGQHFRPPWPPLSSHEIIAARALAEDWQIPPCLVPFMGDFHDLICLDYRERSTPAVVYVDDERSTRMLFTSFESFLDGRIELSEEEPDTSGIVESESWLDF